MKPKKTRHHIYPQSRVRGMGVVGVCMVEQKLHELYHHLFGNMTPEEIVNFLNETYWKNKFNVSIQLKKPPR
jgi:hypothetical protein